MADAAPAAPAAAPSGSQSSSPDNTSIAKATNEALSTLPQDGHKVSAEVDDVEDTGEDLPVEPTKKEVAAAKKAWKLKVAGKDVDVDETELLKRAQMGYSADEKWQEAAKMRKQMDSFIQQLQKDPAKALEQMGFNVDEMAERRIQQRIEEMQKSPQQIEKEKIERELSELKAEREREKEEFRSKEMERLQSKYASEIESDISSALDSGSHGLPKSPYIVKRIADTMILAMQEGRRTNNKQLMEIKAADVLGYVQDEISRELGEMYQVAPDEVFEKLVGKDRLNKYRRAKVSKTTKKPTGVGDIKPTGRQELNAQKVEKPKEKVAAKSFFKNLGTK